MATDDAALINIPKKDKDITQKYVRTYESDMEALKQGGVPELSPLPQAVEKKKEDPTNDAYKANLQIQKEISELVPVALKEADIVVAADNNVAAAPVIQSPPPPPSQPPPSQPPISKLPPPPPPPPPPPTPKPIKDNLETYSSDFAEKIKKEHASTATVLAAEKDAATSDPKKVVQKGSRDHLYIILGSILLLVGGGGAYYAYTQYANTSPPVVLAPATVGPILGEENEKIGGVGIVLLQKIEESVAKPLASNSVRILTLESSINGTPSVFSALKLSAPDIFLRNLSDNGSVAGVINVADSTSPFFILSATSFSETFAGMLAWEPKITKDLERLYPAYAVAAISTTTATTATTTIVLSAKGFKDEVVSNHDVRVYRDAGNRSVILYGYWNKGTLVIARDAAAFSEIIQRLANARTR